MPSIGLTTVARVKDYLIGIGETPPAAHDNLLTFLVQALSADVEEFCGRVFGRATYTGEQHTGIKDQQHLFPRQWPLVTITTVTLKSGDTTTTITEGTTSGNYRKIKNHRGEVVALFREDGWESEPYGISLTYQAGYVLPGDTNPDLPKDLERAVVELVASAYMQRGKAGMAQESFEGFSTTYDRWPLHILHTLRRYKAQRR